MEKLKRSKIENIDNLPMSDNLVKYQIEINRKPEENCVEINMKFYMNEMNANMNEGKYLMINNRYPLEYTYSQLLEKIHHMMTMANNKANELALVHE